MGLDKNELTLIAVVYESIKHAIAAFEEISLIAINANAGFCAVAGWAQIQQ